MGNRRMSRICALQVLYMMESNPVDGEQALGLFWENFKPTSEKPERLEEVSDFTSLLVEGAIDNGDKINDEIQSSSKNWKLNRMAMVDRNILRLAVYELIFMEDIPKRVSINEAIELGKKFGSEDSGSFINGVLDKISQGVDKE